ncbi:hypothetical protein [Cysteiniphilum sp. 6C5]|uniref:hypothetical protein n=1 Tax=unclassified Cysteiniphilum TaxID=2610889 RepID=UPI003F85CFD0
MAKKTKRQRKAEVIKEQSMTPKQKLNKAKTLIESGCYSAAVALISNLERSSPDRDVFVDTLIKGYDGLICQQLEANEFDKAYAAYKKRAKYSEDGISPAITLTLLAKCQLIDEAIAYYREHHMQFSVHKKQDFDAISTLIPYVFLQKRLSKKKDGETYLFRETMIAENQLKHALHQKINENVPQSNISALGVYRDLRLVVKGIQDYTLANIHCFERVKEGSPFKELAMVLYIGLLPKFMHIEYLSCLSKTGVSLYCKLNNLTSEATKALTQLIDSDLSTNSHLQRYLQNNIDSFSKEQLHQMLLKTFNCNQQSKFNMYCVKYGELNELDTSKNQALESLKVAKKSRDFDDVYDCLEMYEDLASELAQKDTQTAKRHASLIYYYLSEEFKDFLDQEEKDEYYEDALLCDEYNLMARSQWVSSQIDAKGYTDKKVQLMIAKAHNKHPDDLTMLENHLQSLHFQNKNVQALNLVSQKFKYPIMKIKSSVLKCMLFSLVEQLKLARLTPEDIDEHISVIYHYLDENDQDFFNILKQAASCLLNQESRTSNYSLLKFSLGKNKTKTNVDSKWQDYFETADHFYCFVILAALLGYSSFNDYPKELSAMAKQKHAEYLSTMPQAVRQTLHRLGGILDLLKYQKLLFPAFVNLVNSDKMSDDTRLELCFVLEDMHLLSYLTKSNKNKLLSGRSKLFIAAQCYYSALESNDKNKDPFSYLTTGDTLNAHLQDLPEDHALSSRITKLLMRYAKKLENFLPELDY